MAATNDANTAIKNRLAAMAQFHPATVNLFDGWLLDPGDIVTVSSGEDDYNVPIYSMDVTWKGSSRTEIQSTGSEKRPPLSALRRNSYATGRRQAEDEAELIRHNADIEKSKERILLWATEEEWNEIEEQWQLTHKSELEVINNAINARVTQTSLNTTLEGYLTITANQTILGNVMNQDGNVTAASIATAINTQTGTGTVTIDADMVNITATTTIGDVMSYGNSNLYVKGDIYAMTPGGSYHALAGNMVVPSNCGLFFATGGSTNVNVYASDMSNLMASLADAQVVADGNNYKLQVKYIGDTGWTDAGTFNRATTLRGGFGSGTQADPYKYWQSGVFKVQADPQGNTKQTSVTVTGHWGVVADDEDDKKYYGDLKATIDTDATLYDTGKTFVVDATSVWMDGYIAGGGGSVTQPTLNVNWGSDQTAGRFTVDTTPTAATNPLEYWFSKGTPVWDTTTNIATVPITTAPSQQGQATTRFSITVDASARYIAGVDYGKVISSITGAWSKTGLDADGTNTLTATATSQGGGTGSTTVNIQMSNGSWNGATIPVYVYQGATRIGNWSITAPLEARTGTNKITTNGTYTPTSGNIGFSSVVVDVPQAAIDLANVTLSPGAASVPTASGSSWYSDVVVTKTMTGASPDNDTISVNVSNPYNTGWTNGNWDDISAGAAEKNGPNWWDEHGVWNVKSVITMTRTDGSTDTKNAIVNIQEAINVAAGEGWLQAYGKVVWPSQGSTSSFSVSAPANTQGNTDTKTFTLSQSGSTVYANDGTNNVAQVAVSGGGSASISGFTVTGITALNPSGGSMFNMSVLVSLSNGNSGTITIPINTSWDNSNVTVDGTTIQYYKKIGEVSGPLTISSGGKSSSRKLTISAPKADSVGTASGAYRVHYSGVTSGQAATQIIPV